MNFGQLILLLFFFPRHHPLFKMPKKKTSLAIDLTDEDGPPRHSGRPCMFCRRAPSSRRCLLCIELDEDCNSFTKGSEEESLALQLLKITVGKTREQAAENSAHPFEHCRYVNDMQHGACASCIWASHAMRCEHHYSNRFETTTSDEEDDWLPVRILDATIDAVQALQALAKGRDFEDLSIINVMNVSRLIHVSTRQLVNHSRPRVAISVSEASVDIKDSQRIQHFNGAYMDLIPGVPFTK
ncbi:hypothetical protein CDD81_7559 [Ophiocordyceps australis]|uniref:Uncharacterized protein n=1 Tax=Ophiocordyceps australis TaxID=1399860 RepID=A0A2C5XGU4_9HYPO|nr:hypothetical protein CDD81_7559 [Ophiocordyceps australis]